MQWIGLIREHELSLPKALVNDRELAVAGTLVDALAEPFDPKKYPDRSREALLELIASQAAGRALAAPAAEAPAPVTRLMAALGADSIRVGYIRLPRAAPWRECPVP